MRIILTGLAAALLTSGLAVAGGLKDTQPDKALGDATGGAPVTKEKTVSPGSAGAPASLTRDDPEVEQKSNVLPATPERSGNAGQPASLVPEN